MIRFLINWFVNTINSLFSESWQAKAIIVLFSVLGFCSLIGAFFNIGQLMLSAMCGILVLAGILEYRKIKRNESKKK